jgi:hypothetical protein
LFVSESWLFALRRGLNRCVKKFFVDLLHGPVDPAEAERFLDRVAVGDPPLAALFRGVNQPDLFFPGVVLLEPGAPRFSCCHPQSLADLHRILAKAFFYCSNGARSPFTAGCYPTTTTPTERRRYSCRIQREGRKRIQIVSEEEREEIESAAIDPAGGLDDLLIFGSPATRRHFLKQVAGTSAAIDIDTPADFERLTS